jgi:hypothetical protein
MLLICKNCFADDELKGFIVSQGNLGTCDCCSSSDTECISISELLDFFSELFSCFKSVSKGSSLISLIQGNWTLFSSKDIGNKILNDVLDKLDNPFSSPDEQVEFSDEILDNVNYWDVLKDQLIWKRRYFTDIIYLTEELGWDGFFESKLKLTKSDVFYRARLHQEVDSSTFPVHKMSCPPREKTTAGRANPMGIPFLYLSDNTETILYEIRASYLDEVSVGTFTIKDDKTVVVISDFTKTPTIYHPGEVSKRIKSTLLKQRISSDLSKPVRRYDSELDYIPTQFICEFIKIFTNVQGIKFRSSLHNTGNNLVIFDEKLMSCDSVKKVRVSKVIIKSTDI